MGSYALRHKFLLDGHSLWSSSRQPQLVDLFLLVSPSDSLDSYVVEILGL